MSEEDRTYCLRWHRLAVRLGLFLAARNALRNALRFRRDGRKASLAHGYTFVDGKLVSYQYGN